MTTETTVLCGACGRVLRRSPRADGKKDEKTEVHSRTLVGGEFLPSCSRACHQELRSRAGLLPRGRAA